MKYFQIYCMIVLLCALMACSETEVMSPSGSNPARMTIAPENASVETGETKRFSLLAYDESGNPIDVDATWSMEKNYGMINDKGYLYIPYDLTGAYPKKDYIIAEYGDLRSRIPVDIKLGKYWIYSENHVPTQFQYDRPNPPVSHGGKLLQYGGVSISDYADDPGSDISCLRVQNSSFGGLFWIYNNADNPVSENLYNYRTGYLSFYIKIEELYSGDILIELSDFNNNKTQRYLIGHYGVPVDNEWNLVEIPLRDFADVDFSELKIPLNFYLGAPCTLYLDDIHFYVE